MAASTVIDDAVGEGLTLTLATVSFPAQGGYVAKQCAHRAHNDNDPLLDPALKDELGAATLQRMQEGIDFEAQVGAHLREVLSGAVFIPECDRTPESKAAREQATVAAMREGMRFIWNARLPVVTGTSRISEPDALVRFGVEPRPDGNWAYVPVDVKHHRSLEGTAAAVPQTVSELCGPRVEEAFASRIGVGKPRVDDSMQLAHYHRHLQSLGHAPEGPGPVLGGIVGKELMIVWRDIDAPGPRGKPSPLAHYDEAFAHRLAVIERAVARGADPSLEPLTGPEWTPECKECPWRTVCHDDLVAAGHITLLPGVTAARAKAHYAQGVTTVNQLSSLDWATAVVIESGSDIRPVIERARRARNKAAAATTLLDGIKGSGAIETAFSAAGIETVGDVAGLDERTLGYAGAKATKLSESIDQARVYRSERIHRRRGIRSLDVPRGDIELDVDMENDPGGLIYLWGTRLWVDPASGIRLGKQGYRSFATFAGTDSGEAAVFAGLWRWMTALRTLAEACGLTFRAYCYSDAEARCMRHIVDTHVGRPGVPSTEELEDFLASEEWVDLRRVFEGQLFWPTEDHSVKSLAKYAKFAWRDDEAGGDNSTVWYKDAVGHPDGDVRAANRERILRYNEDDVHATWHLRDFMARLLASTNASSKIPPVSALERRFRRR